MSRIECNLHAREKTRGRPLGPAIAMLVITVTGLVMVSLMLFDRVSLRGANTPVEVGVSAPGLLSVGAAPGTPPDLTRTDYSAGCQLAGCHQELGETKWVHGPVAVGACVTCHEPRGEIEDHSFARAATKSDLCTRCHALVGDLAFEHEPYVLGQCTDCHDPHGGENKNFTTMQRAEDLCRSCHEAATRSSPHPPVYEGDCLTCHEPHASNHEHLLTHSAVDTCTGCHREPGQLVMDVGPGRSRPALIHGALETTDCLGCHNAHEENNPALLEDSEQSLCIECHERIVRDLPLAESLHGAFEGANACTMCHAPHSSPYANLLDTEECELCFKCHREKIEAVDGSIIPSMKNLVESSAFVHEPAAYGECTACHQPHFSDQHALLKESYPSLQYAEFDPGAYALCMQCHDDALIEAERTTATRFRDGDHNLHFVHTNREKGRTCLMCHQPHAGQVPHLLRLSTPFGPGGWPLPVGFEETPTGGSCNSGCHEPRTYNFDTPDP